jgi:formylglycine-generating enzyme required for sulfatase activity
MLVPPENPKVVGPFAEEVALKQVEALILLTVAACAGATDDPVAVSWTEPITGMEFVLVPAGEFIMGLNRGPGDVRPAPSHRVRLSQPFYLGRFEVTQSQWTQVMGASPSQLLECGPDCPVETVSWNDVTLFLERLSALNPDERFRLPTEAEWEYACRSGTEYRHGTADTLSPAAANYDSRIPFEGAQDTVFLGTTTPVGAYPPNRFGLHDMLGNVWEWTADEFCPYGDSLSVDPAGRCGTDTIPIRGGSWYFSANAARCGRRYTHARGDSGFSLGFRVVREPTTASPAT